jgi:CspA family cold shock protein
MPKGVIKRLVADRGFGFISTGQRGGDIFFHFSVLQESQFEDLKEGQNVDYEVDPNDRGAKGPRASSVTPTP